MLARICVPIFFGAAVASGWRAVAVFVPGRPIPWPNWVSGLAAGTIVGTAILVTAVVACVIADLTATMRWEGWGGGDDVEADEDEEITE